MRISAEGPAFIEAFEGKFLYTYDDGTGVLTIGYGHTSAAGPPKVVRGQTVPVTQAQFDALVSFHFNTGALRKGSIDDKINAGNPAGAMDILLQYDHAGGRVMAGLTRRRQAERLLFTGQVAQALKPAGAHAKAVTLNDGNGQQHRGLPALRAGHLRAARPVAHVSELQEQALRRPDWAAHTSLIDGVKLANQAHLTESARLPRHLLSSELIDPVPWHNPPCLRAVMPARLGRHASPTNALLSYRQNPTRPSKMEP
jgi:GH24 family phage-related lysozyme (muramidase)